MAISRLSPQGHAVVDRKAVGFVRGNRARGLGKGQVHHVPYPAHEATLHATHDDLMAAAGLPRTNRPPSAVHFAPGVEVEVFGPWDEGDAR